MQDQLTAPSVLTFTVVAAVVTTVGTLAGHFLKEALLARSFEKWKSRNSAEAAFRRYRDPIILSALDLSRRLEEILRDYPADFLRNVTFGTSPIAPSLEPERNEYFKRYKLESSVYRLAAFLGWLELYRQDLVFLDGHRTKRQDSVQASLENIRSALGDGQLNTASDWQEWSDALLMREEQRAVGETMIASVDKTRVVVGYAAFQMAILSGEKDSNHRWYTLVLNFLAEPKDSRDFRRTRYAMLLSSIANLVKSLDSSRMTETLTKFAQMHHDAEGKLTPREVANMQ